MDARKELVLRAHGKINLGLDVVGIRTDGYHEVRMVMQSIGLHDRISMRRESETGIHVSSNLSFLPVNETNLAYRAAKLLLDEFEISEGVSLTLEKHIPVSAGLAGGSADAAAVLQGINRMFSLGLSEDDLLKRGLSLGADVPFCLMGGTVLAEGIGERLSRLPDAPDSIVLLAKPSFGLSTRYIYEHLVLDEDTKHVDLDGLLAAVRVGDLKGMAACMGNTLEEVARAEHVQIGQLEELMLENGAVGAMMSGSGPTVFGLFEEIGSVRRAARACRKRQLARQIFITELYHGRRGGRV